MDNPLSRAIPKEYGYVLLTLTSNFVLTMYHGSVVSKMRKAAGIPYPRHYAETWELPAAAASGKGGDVERRTAEYRFNCAQRAHGQFLEQMPVFLPSLLLAGLRWPLASAALGAGFVASRLAFLLGYVYSDKAKGAGRYYGISYVLCQLGLLGMVGKMGYDIAFA